ncbi:DUF3800 domain-containing protein [Metabacillus sp. JX24]|uniref:DUF3800 domain-containing protein n=1 Tax=Metabacillus sp. JX24 TaxID=3240759 RepID=UPI00350FBDC0
MNSYHLFLDEILPSENLDYFCLAGVLLDERTYTKEIIPAVNKIKQEIFGDTTTILHDAEIRYAKKGSRYEIFKKAETRNTYWKEVKSLLQNHEMFILSASIHEKDLFRLYPTMRDKYFICLQVILENYVNFLERHNGIGNIAIESRNPGQNDQLQSHFHILKANGTLFYEPKVLQKHLLNISFPLKEDNNIGLQIADMIPNPLNRDLSGTKQKIKGLVDIIHSKAYDGLVEEKQRFGIKVMPRK